MAVFFFDPGQVHPHRQHGAFACRHHLFSGCLPRPQAVGSSIAFCFTASLSLPLYFCPHGRNHANRPGQGYAIFRTARHRHKGLCPYSRNPFHPDRRESGTGILRHAVPGISGGYANASNVFILKQAILSLPYPLQPFSSSSGSIR